LKLNFETAKTIAEAAHAAWNAEDIEAVLGQYVDDLVYVSNAGGKNGKKLVVRGRSGLRELLTPVLPFIQNRTAIETFMFRDDVAHLQVSFFTRVKRTGLEHSGTYRQIMQFRGFKIGRLEEIHDAAMLNAFWRLVAAENVTSGQSSG
jgi:ketosteroid isomerase-like protein